MSTQSSLFPAIVVGVFVVAFADGREVTLARGYADHGGLILAETENGDQICLLKDLTVILGRRLAVAEKLEPCLVGR